MVAAAAMVGTLPGRSQGLGLVTEPLLADLGLDRVTYATLNLWATLIGSAGALAVGYALDRFGSRLVLTTVLASLGVVVCAMSRAESYTTLAIWVTLTRALGQSALSVVSLAIVGYWFHRRIDSAMAVFSIAISVGFMAAFPAVGYAVQAYGWRFAWLALGVCIAAVLAPLASALVPDNPEGGPAGQPEPSIDSTRESGVIPAYGYTWTAAMAMPSFWVFAVGTALYGLVASGIGLFNESILAQRGFGPGVYYQTLAVTALTALAGNFFGGWLAARVALGRLMAVSLFILAAGLVALPFVTSLMHVMAWAVAMGVGGGLVMVLFFSVWGRLFGTFHLGRIQGFAQALTVVASATGPLLLAWCVEWTGSYTPVFAILSGVISLVALCAVVVSLPAPPPVVVVRPRAEDWNTPA